MLTTNCKNGESDIHGYAVTTPPRTSTLASALHLLSREALYYYFRETEPGLGDCSGRQGPSETAESSAMGNSCELVHTPDDARARNARVGPRVRLITRHAALKLAEEAHEFSFLSRIGTARRENSLFSVGIPSRGVELAFENSACSETSIHSDRKNTVDQRFGQGS